jgi:flagellar biosynthetic protein FliR
MPGNAWFEPQHLTGFLLTLTRVSSALLLLPMPGLQNLLQTARVVLILGVTLCLSSVWTTVALSDSNLNFLVALVAEASIGLIIGLTLSFLFETFQIGAQAISFQTGFGFATTFDPQSQADSGLFQTFTQLTTGLLFFSLGVHGQIVRMLGRSFSDFSANSGHARDVSVLLILHLGSKMFIDGLKLALPVVTLLFLVDQGLAALTRLQAQLQLLTLAFPAKILLSIMFLAGMLIRWSNLFERFTSEIFNYSFRLLTL